jgi:hypothetical protein
MMRGVVSAEGNSAGGGDFEQPSETNKKPNKKRQKNRRMVTSTEKKFGTKKSPLGVDPRGQDTNGAG